MTGIIEHHLIDRHGMRQNISTNDIYKRCGDDEVEVSVSNSEIWLAIQDSSFLEELADLAETILGQLTGFIN